MSPQTPEELAAEITERVRGNEVWACPDCVPALSVRTPATGAVTVTATHSRGCQAIAYWLLLAPIGDPPPGLTMPVNPSDPTNPHGPNTTNEGEPA